MAPNGAPKSRWRLSLGNAPARARYTVAIMAVLLALYWIWGLVTEAAWIAAVGDKVECAAIPELDRDKIYITDQECRQIFQPYVEPTEPVFITSDSILHAYHVLLEESVVRAEQANSAILPAILDRMWTNLESADAAVRGDPKLVARAKRRAQIVVGTAIGLLGRATVKPDAETAALIAQEVSRIEAASGWFEPSWLGASNGSNVPTIDYSRYKPRGFYTRTESLARYFRAVSWLQSISFWVAEDEQLLAILMLGNCLAPARFPGEEEKYGQYTSFFQCFKELIGEHDDWDLLQAAALVPGDLALDLSAGDLATVRRALKDKARKTGHKPQINDQITVSPIPLDFRIISAYRTPEAVLFQRTTDPLQFTRQLPSGLEVCIALGSEHAARCLDDPQKDQVLEVIDDSKDLFKGQSLYFDYLNCVKTLLEPARSGAPAFMSGDAWQTKSCQTALAGWAQLRHTWILQTKQTCVYRDGSLQEYYAGFVEPNPQFFRRLQDVAQRTAEVLERAPTCKDGRLEILVELQDLLRFLEARAIDGKGLDEKDSDSLRDMFALDTLFRVMQSRPPEMDRAEAREYIAAVIAKVKGMISVIQRGETVPNALAYWQSSQPPRNLGKLWRELRELCGRLEALAEKQLAGAALTREDNDFIRGYGKALAPLMFHVGDASESPRDDVPRIADVVSNPNVGQYLEVGIGRPRIMYVLYPTLDSEILCRGAVLPYYEFPSGVRLDDDEWRSLLESRKRPNQPTWIASCSGRASVWRKVWWPVHLLAAAIAVVAAWYVVRPRSHRQVERGMDAIEA